MMEMGPTFAEMDRQAADREAKRREVVERLAKLLAREFSLAELRFIWTFPGNAIQIESYEQARNKTRR